MGIYLEEQVRVFLLSLGVGAVFGLLYDVFRLSRVAFRTTPAAIFAEDVLFFIACAVVTFFFGLTVMEGAFRAFLLIGELLGAVLYHFTLGRAVMGVSVKIIALIKAILRFFFKWVLLPLWWLFYHIVALLLKPFTFFKGILKKILQNIKIRLKTRRRVLYNQVNTLFLNKRKALKHRSRKNEKT